MNILRTRFAKDIVAEFVFPQVESNKVIILCTGMPGYPGRREELLTFFSSQGYWVILPVYRGTWESDGNFLKESPHKDILDIIHELEKGFVSLWDGHPYAIKNPEVYLVGSSFGGAATLLASVDSHVKRAVAFSPVVDWTIESKAEPFDHLSRFMREAFGNAYRCEEGNFLKLKKGGFYNPVDALAELDGKKILIFHAKDDAVVAFAPVEAFAQKLGCSFMSLEIGGHLSTSAAQIPEFWEKIKQFFA